MSFTLELTFNGLIYIAQHKMGSANPGLHLLMPVHSGHATMLEFDAKYSQTGATSLRLRGPYDLFGAGGSGQFQPMPRFASLSAIEGKPVAVDNGWFATSPHPAGLESRIRLPLADQVKPDGDLVHLEFTNGAGVVSSQKVAGRGIISVGIDANELAFDGEILTPVGGAMALCVKHLPSPEPEELEPPCAIPHHHIHSLYQLLVSPGRPAATPPSVYYREREKSGGDGFVQNKSENGFRGGDPAQCTPGTC